MPNQLKLKWQAPKGIEKKEKRFFDKKEECVRKAAFAKQVDDNLDVDALVEVDGKGWTRVEPVHRTGKAKRWTGAVTFCLSQAKTGTRHGEVAKREMRDGVEWVRVSTVPVMSKKAMVGARLVYA